MCCIMTPSASLLDGRAGCVPACGRPVRPCFPGDNRNELVGRIEIAHQEQIFDLGDDRPHQLAPTGRVVLDAQESVSSSRSRARKALGDTVSRQVAMRSGGSSLMRSTSIAWMRAPDSSRP